MVRVEKYEEEKGVPFRNEKKIELPELDYEITEKDDDFTPEWMRNRHRTKQDEQQERQRTQRQGAKRQET